MPTWTDKKTGKGFFTEESYKLNSGLPRVVYDIDNKIAYRSEAEMYDKTKDGSDEPAPPALIEAAGLPAGATLRDFAAEIIRLKERKHNWGLALLS